MLAKFGDHPPDHVEDWESSAVHMRAELRKQVFGDFPKLPRPAAQLGKTERAEGVTTTPLVLQPEPDLPLHAVLKSKQEVTGKAPACVLLHLDGKAEALKHPLAAALVNKGWTVLAPELRATGEMQPPKDKIRDAPDHNSAEHGLWMGRPLLGQWVFDVLAVLDWLGLQPGLDKRRFAVVGLGQAGLVALCAAGLFEDRVTAAAAVESPISYVTEEAYGPGTRMGLLAPGLLRVGDVPHLAALVVPRRLVVSGGLSPQMQKRTGKQVQEAYAFTAAVYKLHKATDRLTLTEDVPPADFAAAL
jgi:pimeloyl-ACP methyl ester carboxylesterase